MATGDKFYLGGQKALANYYSYNASITTTEVNVPLNFTSSNIKFLSNDGDTDLIVTFNTVATTVTTALNGPITLKSGEVLNELNIAVTRINFKRVSGTGDVRVVIV